MTTYSEYYELRNVLECIMPLKYDLKQRKLPEIVRLKAEELRLVCLGALAELNEQGWEDDD